MDLSGSGKSPNTSLSFRYNANNEELEELYQACYDDPPTPHCDISPNVHSENASPKKLDKSSSILDKYFKSIRVDKLNEKLDETKNEMTKAEESTKPSKDVTSSPMKEYLNRLGKRNTTTDANTDLKEGANETWKIFHDFKYKITQAVEDIKSRSVEETREKSVPRDNSMSDSEENSAIRDSDQQSVGDTDNQVSSLDSSIQNLSEMTQPVTAKPNEGEPNAPVERNTPESSDDTHKNLANESSEANKDLLEDNSLMEVESGVEALEESNIETGDVSQTDIDGLEPKLSISQSVTPPKTPLPPNRNNLSAQNKRPKKYFTGFCMMLLTTASVVSYVLFPNASFWNGLLIGVWLFYFLSTLQQWLLDTYFKDWEMDGNHLFHMRKIGLPPPIYTIPSVKEHKPLKKYEGWINHYRFPDYDPYTYHINKTITAFMKLEGCNLRISYTRVKVAKRALWDEKLDSVVFYQHRLYNLTGAKLILMPKDLVRKRQWSKKYPICIILSEKEKIQVLEKESNPSDKRPSESQSEKKKESVEVETVEVNTSPEKKKKFVWRRKDKSISHTDSETGKEGLRHRIARKMHRDKKSDSVSTSTEPGEGLVDKNVQLEESSFHDPVLDVITKSMITAKEEILEEDIDENELLRIKDFLEEAELEEGVEGASEGEWSVQVKESRDKHSHLYLFARTGRDKHEWYRRLNTAISEANAASAESSAADEGSVSDPFDREVEMAVYKVAEKEAIAFAKPSSKLYDSISETVTVTSTSQPLGPSDWESYEKTFWPYLFKIIQRHKVNVNSKPEVGVMCQIEPTPRNPSKKKRKSDSKNTQESLPSALPTEVTWLNALLARLIYDVMRDPQTIGRVQNRIQRKLNTLKLPSFMSPLMITELSMGSACPLIERVCGPAWDERGIWLDADMRYEGGAYIALLTQINLMKLKEKNMSLDSDQLEKPFEEDLKNPTASGGCMSPDKQTRDLKPAIYDSDVEDSAESSSDDESPPLQPMDSSEHIPTVSDGTTTPDGGSSKKKFLRMVDKIATNKYFQQVTDYKYVKRAMEGLSNTDIRLQLELRLLDGRLAVNLPPPPHDRVWIGFRTNPQLVLRARPAVGARAVRFAHITNWIEQKLSKEFEKVLVLPNMEDVLIDLMTPTPVRFE